MRQPNRFRRSSDDSSSNINAPKQQIERLALLIKARNMIENGWVQ
jgi:hypothetical protein